VQLAEALRPQRDVEGGGVSSRAIENVSGESVSRFQDSKLVLQRRRPEKKRSQIRKLQRRRL